MLNLLSWSNRNMKKVLLALILSLIIVMTLGLVSTASDKFVGESLCFLSKLFLILWCSREIADILESVFRTVLSRKCGSFHKRGQTNDTHFLYSYVWLCTSVRTPHTIQVWGIVSFILLRSFHNLLFDKRESTPHFLFYTNPPHRS